MITWNGTDLPDPVEITAAGWLRVVLRSLPLFAVLSIGLVILLLVRLIERPIYGLRRPWTPYIGQTALGLCLRIIGLRYSSQGAPMAGPGAVVSNHASWLDIFALNARQRVYFVSKSEVASWPVIGFMARSAGTMFISRDRKQAKLQNQLFLDRLTAGHKLMFFPEGTSTDGLRVLPFRSTLFESFFNDDLRPLVHLQPVTVTYQGPAGADPRFYAWWGDMGFGGHLLKLLAAPRHGQVVVHYHPPLKVADFENRKALAVACEEAVRGGLHLSPEAQRALST